MVSENATTTGIYTSLSHDVHAHSDIIKFSNAITDNKARNNGEKFPRYKQEKLKKAGTFDVLNNNSENVPLVQSMDSLVNVSC